MGADPARRLDVNRAFTSLSIFMLLGRAVTFLVQGALGIVVALNCFERVRAHLAKCGPNTTPIMPTDKQSEIGEKVDSDSTLQDLKFSNYSDQRDPSLCVVAKGVSFGGSPTTGPVLKDLTFQVERGSITAVVGPIGCGKSLLLAALINEADSIGGDFYLSYRIAAYCSQAPWLMNQSIRRNILGTSSYDEFRYKSVVQCCALTHDFGQMPEGDQTTVGTKGVRLSGGQQIRVVWSNQASMPR